MSNWADQFKGVTVGSLTKKMNKNPDKPNNVDEIISQILNPKKPKETQDQKNKRIRREIQKLIWK
jgi:hypothetical protein